MEIFIALIFLAGVVTGALASAIGYRFASAARGPLLEGAQHTNSARRSLYMPRPSRT